MKHHEKLHYLIFACLLVAGLCGCSEAVRPHISNDHATAGDTIAELGRWAIGCGGFVLILCAIAFVFGLFPQTSPFVAPVAPFIDEIALAAGATILVGSCLVWVGLHSWVIFAVFAAIGLIYLVRHRAMLLSWLGFGPASAKDSSPSDHG